MDQNTQLKIEFFELCRLLNRSNVHANQKTEISFLIETSGNKSILYATTNKAHKIQLIFKNSTGNWKSSGFSGLINLEYELTKILGQINILNTPSTVLTKLIKSFIFKKFD